MILKHFTPEQIKELSEVFGLGAKGAYLKVSDGFVGMDEMVWWKSEVGPEHVLARSHDYNIKEYPHIYSIEKPVVAKVQYV